MCFSAILDNPIHYFNDEAFVNLSPQSLKSIVIQSKINCNKKHLVQNVLKWLQHQQQPEIQNYITLDKENYKTLKTITGIREEDFNKKEYFNLNTDSFGRFERDKFQISRTVCKINNNGASSKFLHGLGFYTGTEIDCQETITITLSEINVSAPNGIINCTVLKKLKYKIKQERTVSICSVMFDKIEVKKHLLCEIDFGTSKQRFCVKTICYDKYHCHFTRKCRMFPRDNNTRFTCVVYLLCSDGQTASKAVPMTTAGKAVSIKTESRRIQTKPLSGLIHFWNELNMIWWILGGNVVDGIPLVQIRLGMVNDSKLADITFSVGEKNVETIYAHKAVLIMQSEVFACMFSGNFSTPKNIIIKDMEPDVFLEMLKFVYAGADAVNITTKNMIGILYGAQKYILPELQSLCETFILENTNDSNMMKVFDSSQYFENRSKWVFKTYNSQILITIIFLYFSSCQ
jgi:hypothetical protein